MRHLGEHLAHGTCSDLATSVVLVHRAKGEQKKLETPRKSQSFQQGGGRSTQRMPVSSVHKTVATLRWRDTGPPRSHNRAGEGGGGGEGAKPSSLLTGSPRSTFRLLRKLEANPRETAETPRDCLRGREQGLQQSRAQRLSGRSALAGAHTDQALKALVPTKSDLGTSFRAVEARRAGDRNFSTSAKCVWAGPTSPNPAPLPCEGLAAWVSPGAHGSLQRLARGQCTPAGAGTRPAPSVWLGQAAAGASPQPSTGARRLALPGRAPQAPLAGVRSEGANVSSLRLSFLGKGSQRRHRSLGRLAGLPTSPSGPLPTAPRARGEADHPRRDPPPTAPTDCAPGP